MCGQAKKRVPENDVKFNSIKFVLIIWNIFNAPINHIVKNHLKETECNYNKKIETINKKLIILSNFINYVYYKLKLCFY